MTHPVEEVDQWLSFLRIAFPTGIYFKDISAENVESLPWTVLCAIPDPLFLRLRSRQVDGVLRSLVEHGMGPSMPAIVLQGAPESGIRLVGTLGDIALRSRRLTASHLQLLVTDDPDLVRPTQRLSGRSVLVTRARKQAGDLTLLLEQEGARVLEVPAIEIVLQPEKLPELQEAIRQIGRYSWLLLTSANSVGILDEALKHIGLQWSIFSGIKIGCIGPATAERVQECGGTVALVPDDYQAEGLMEHLQKESLEGKEILLPRAQGSREVLPQALSRQGATVHEIHIYRAELPESSRQELQRILQTETVDFITFTSSSTVHNFVEMAGDLLAGLDWSKTKIAAIGPITAATLQHYNMPASIQAKEFTIPGLVQAIVEGRS